MDQLATENADDDVFTCESCGETIPIDEAIGSDDYWYCRACYGAWKAEFDACTHQWEPSTDCFGDSGQYCLRCSGFVNDDKFDGLFPDARREAG